MGYKIANEDANGNLVIDGREGIMLGEPGVEILERFQPKEKKQMPETAEGGRTKIGLDRSVKLNFDEAQKELGAATDLIAWNDKATMSELRFYINAAVVKQAVGGRGTEIKKYLETRQEEIDTLNQLYKLKPSINYGRNNVRERLYPDLVVEPDEEE